MHRKSAMSRIVSKPIPDPIPFHDELCNAENGNFRYNKNLPSAAACGTDIAEPLMFLKLEPPF
jgi:hypothetical protein